MWKILWISLAAIAVSGAIYFFRIIGDVRPAVLPPKVQPSQNLNTSEANPSLKVPLGLEIRVFADNLGAVRDLEFSPGGTLLASVPPEGRIIAIRQNNKKAEVKDVLQGLDRPHGIAFYNGSLFVAEEKQVTRYSWDEQNLQANRDIVLFEIPGGGRHFTRSITFGRTGKLYLSIGSTCDVCNENHPFLAAVVVSDSEGTNPRVFSNGLRNSVFVALNPNTNEVWATEMGRDFLGDNLPLDEVNILKDGKNYGWPNCYGNKVPDRNFNPGGTCTDTESPIYEIPAHSAPLGLTFINSSQFPPEWQGDLLVSYHGSWNRSSPIGYKVVRMNVEGNQILGEEDFLTDFLDGSEIIGRPVDLTFDKDGNLYISDDKNGIIYIIRQTR